MLAPRETLVVREGTTKSMRSNRPKDTRLEVRFRKALWAEGVRGYRKNVFGLPGRPDLVFGAKKLVVFVHGCYWHRCPKCRKDAHFKTNEAFWRSKLQVNVERDIRNQELLIDLGYRVLVFWECEIMKHSADCVAKVKCELQSN